MELLCLVEFGEEYPRFCVVDTHFKCLLLSDERLEK